MILSIDIETIPSQAEGALQSIEVSPPGNIKKPESIAKWHEEKGEAAKETEWRKTALNGTTGEIICIGFAVDDQEPIAIYRELEWSESELLSKFVDTIYEVYKSNDLRPPVWVGHNITGFDLRFIWQRLVINNIRSKFHLPYDAKPWSDLVFDTMIEWSGKTSGSLDKICKAFGYEGKGDIDGSKVWDYVKDGKIKEVAEYCKDDVRKTRDLYNRMTFQYLI